MYGAAVLRLPYPETTDGYIPWRLFWRLYAHLPRVFALERLNTTQAVGTAVGLAMGEQGGPAARLVAQDIDTALPFTEP